MECEHCGRLVEDDDGIWFHPDTMQARCDGRDDEPGLSWGDMVRQAEPVSAVDTDEYDWEDDDSDDEPAPGTDEYARKYPLREDVRQAEMWGGVTE